MPDDNEHSRWSRWFTEAMDSLGFHVEGEGRERTRRNNMWTNDRREEWDSKDAEKDRAWVRTSRESAGKRGDGAREVVKGLVLAVLGALVMFGLGKLGLK